MKPLSIDERERLMLAAEILLMIESTKLPAVIRLLFDYHEKYRVEQWFWKVFGESIYMDTQTPEHAADALVAIAVMG